MNKKIGISLRVTAAEGYDEKRDSLSQEWPQLLEELGFDPIFIPNSLKNIDKFLENINIDGLILSGGENIGENKLRDQTEIKIIKFAIEKKLPVFGVCRGMQIINKFFGGKIRITNNKEHVKKNHEVSIYDKKLIENIKNEKILVNSFHENIITKKILGNKLEILGLCEKDNTVEMFRHNQLPITGVMWHPERDPNEINKEILKKALNHD
jgi:N5-(cytidine 5'-diphosphoramidyl)-L-glutamine hydrolase